MIPRNLCLPLPRPRSHILIKVPVVMRPYTTCLVPRNLGLPLPRSRFRIVINVGTWSCCIMLVPYSSLYRARLSHIPSFLAMRGQKSWMCCAGSKFSLKRRVHLNARDATSLLHRVACSCGVEHLETLSWHICVEPHFTITVLLSYPLHILPPFGL